MTKPIKPIKKFCPDCRRVPLTQHHNFYSCPCCGGELWNSNWFAGGDQEQDTKVYIDMMQEMTIKGRRRSSKSGRRRKRQYKIRPSRHWLDDYN